MYRNFKRIWKSKKRNLSYDKGLNSYLKLTIERPDGDDHYAD